MTRFLFAAAIAALFAVPVTADDPPVTAPAPTVVTQAQMLTLPQLPAPTVTTTTQSYVPVRRGLFARLRARNYSSTMTNTLPYTPTGPVIGTGTAPVISTPGANVPLQMPPVTTPPRSGATATPAVTGNPVVVTGGTPNGTVVNSGGVITTPGGVVPAGGVVMSDGTIMTTSGTMMTSTTTQSTQRMGILARLRARRLQ